MGTGDFTDGAYLSQPLVEPGSDDDFGVDGEPDLVAEVAPDLATEAGSDFVAEVDDDFVEETLSAEEAAIRIVDEPPGASYAPTPGYLDR